jgi:DHA3 family tetracycline resistance protein-like MFS transporter
MLAPLRNRDFALLWGGMTVSLLGDGIYFVAIAWEALSISNTATALALVGVAWTLPTIACLLLGGSLSDRVDRRRVMLWATVAQALAIGAIGVLSVAGALELWELVCLVALYGAAQAFFLPAFEAIVPTLVGVDELTHASALDQFVRPLSVQLAGPAIGGVLVAVAGPGVAFLVDAGTFLVAGCALVAMRAGARRGTPTTSSRSPFAGLGEALRFVRANPWLARTLIAAAITLLVFLGPYQVLLPFVVKNVLHAGSGTLGAIRALGGVGALTAALAVGQRGLPGRFMSAMFGAWALQSLALAGYAIAGGVWVFALIALLSGACGAVGNVIWGTLMKTRVPNEMLGRVASLDWLVSIGLTPVSFAITAPIAHAFGARATLLGAGLIAATTLLCFLIVPSLRAPSLRATERIARRREPLAQGPEPGLAAR